jgi:hypothetical protein
MAVIAVLLSQLNMLDKAMMALLMVLLLTDAALLKINLLETAFVNMFTGNHATTTNGIAVTSQSIATKSAVVKFLSTIRNNAAVMFHSITVKHAADIALSTTIHATAHTVQNTHVKNAVNMFLSTTTNVLAAIQKLDAAQQVTPLLLINQRFVCQTGGNAYLSVFYLGVSSGFGGVPLFGITVAGAGVNFVVNSSMT